jgi:hypothetical protein
MARVAVGGQRPVADEQATLGIRLHLRDCLPFPLSSSYVVFIVHDYAGTDSLSVFLTWSSNFPSFTRGRRSTGDDHRRPAA